MRKGSLNEKNSESPTPVFVGAREKPQSRLPKGPRGRVSSSCRHHTRKREIKEKNSKHLRARTLQRGNDILIARNLNVGRNITTTERIFRGIPLRRERNVVDPNVYPKSGNRRETLEETSCRRGVRGTPAGGGKKKKKKKKKGREKKKKNKKRKKKKKEKSFLSGRGLYTVQER